MIEVKLNTKFNIILCTFDSINYLINKNELLKFFKNVKIHLNINGYFLFDINTPNLYIAKHKGIIRRDINSNKFKQILNNLLKND